MSEGGVRKKKSSGCERRGEEKTVGDPSARRNLRLELCRPYVCLSDMITIGLQNEKEVVRKAGIERVKKFLSSHTCYDMLKPSGKVGALAVDV